MSAENITTATVATELADLAKKINDTHQECINSQVNALNFALECGRIGIAAKDKLARGKFLQWIDEHTSVGRRSMQVYMRIAERWSEIGAKAQSAAHLSLAAALKLLTDKPSVRRSENAQKVDAVGDDVAVDFAGKPTLGATMATKLATLPCPKCNGGELGHGGNREEPLDTCRGAETQGQRGADSSAIGDVLLVLAQQVRTILKKCTVSERETVAQKLIDLGEEILGKGEFLA